MPEAVRTVQNDISGEIYMTKDILVRVRGVQTIGEEEDTVEMITPGTYYDKNGNLGRAPEGGGQFTEV